MADKEHPKGTDPESPGVNRPQLTLPDTLDPQYSNVVRISHTPSEMVFDFAQLLPGTAKAPIRARILMTPLNAKLLLRALAENVKKFEATFGEVQIPHGRSLADNLFRSLNNPEKPDEPGKDDE